MIVEGARDDSRHGHGTCRPTVTDEADLVECSMGRWRPPNRPSLEELHGLFDGAEEFAIQSVRQPGIHEQADLAV